MARPCFLASAVFFVSLAGGEASPDAGCRPVFPGDFPDPYVLRVEDSFYAYSTNARGRNTPVIRSRNLRDWEEVGDALPRLPGWAHSVGFLNWAPAVVQVEDRFILYYTTRYKEADRQAISYAVSRSPTGPFVDPNRKPVVFQEEQGGSIDPEVFRDHDGQLYLLWKSDANALNLPSALYGQKLAANGRTLIGRPERLLVIDQPWEQPLIENPSILHENGRYYLIYSANWWESEHYAVGYATSEHPLGPYTKQEGGPILRSSGQTTRGPGGASFFRDAQGNPWVAYHAWTAPHIGYPSGGARSMHVARVRFDEGKLRFYCVTRPEGPTHDEPK
jgi:beta-xylosidase